MHSDDVFDSCVQDCCVAYTRKSGKSPQTVGFDPISIFTAILALIGQICPTPSAGELKSHAQRRSGQARLTVQSATRMALREKFPDVLLPYRRYDGDNLVDAVMETFASRSEADIAAVKSCCLS